MACPACSQGKERRSTKHSQQIDTAGGAAAPDQQQQPQSPGSSPSAGRVSRQASYPLEVWSQCAELLRDSRLLPAMEHLQRVPKQQHSRAIVCYKASIPSRIRKQLILNVDLAFHFIMPLMVGTRHSIKTMLRLKHLSKRCSCLADGQGKLAFSRSENGCGHHVFEHMWQTGASEQLQRTRPLLAPDNAGRCLTGLCSSAATPVPPQLMCGCREQSRVQRRTFRSTVQARSRRPERPAQRRSSLPSTATSSRSGRSAAGTGAGSRRRCGRAQLRATAAALHRPSRLACAPNRARTRLPTVR